MTRSSEITEDKNRVTVQNKLDSLGTKIDSLEAELRLRRQRLLRDEGAEVLEDLVSRNGEACLQSARTVHRAYTAEYRPTARSVAQRRGSGVRIPEWEEQVRRDSESNPPPPESTPASIGGSDGKLKIEFDEGYTSDDVGQAGVHEGTEVIPLDVLTSVVSDHINEAQKCRRMKKYDEAAMHQWKAIHYSEQKAQAPYSVEFRDSQIMKLTLADLYLECRKYANAVTILTKLLKEGRTDASQCAALNSRLGAAYLQQGKLQAAASHANDANNWKESNLDKEDPSLVESLTLLSTIYDKMGKSMLSRGFALKAMHHRILIKGQLNAEIENAFQGERSEEDQALTQTLKDILERVDDVDGSRGVLALQTFHHAVAFNRLEVTTFLWQYSATVRESIDVLNEVGMAPLISATRFGHEDMVRFLLVKGANVNARFDDADIRGESALLIAAEKQLKGIIELLLDHGADPLQSNSLGRNVLHRAIGPPADAEDMVRKEIIQLLLRRNTSALLQARCGAKMTAIHLAAETGNLPIYRFLSDRGADIEARDCGGRTTLLIAIDEGKADIVQAAIDCGADIFSKDIYERDAKKAAKKPTGNAQKIQGILKVARDAKRAPNGSRRPPPITTNRFLGDGPSSTSLQARSSRTLSVSPLSPPSRDPTVWRTSSSEDQSTFDTLSVRSTGTTMSRWREGLIQKWGSKSNG